VLVQDALCELDLGNSVAEFDTALERFFVETHTFRQLVLDKVDVVAGDKGTGKTALFRILQQRYREIPELRDVELIPAFNPVGNPVFQRLAEGEVLTEGQYITIWKAYILALVGNWVLGTVINEMSPIQRQLDTLLRRVDLRSMDDSPNTIFSQVVNLVRRITNPKSVSAAVTLLPTGMPVMVPKVELGDPTPPAEPGLVTHEEALQLLNEVLAEIDIRSWLAFDRLDEAFQGFPLAEVPALRALFRTYLDLLPYERIKVKLFVRRDLFRRIVTGGFVNLTHINARKIEITWDENDLRDLLDRRLRENTTFLDALGLTPDDGDDVFKTLFPDQVDPGSRKPKTWTWMMRRIRDGNDVRPPRNLIDLIKKAQGAQLRKEERDHRQYDASQPLFASESIKRGLAMLSDERVQDTLLAEAGDLAPYIEAFRGGKAEHSVATIAATLSLAKPRVAARPRSGRGAVAGVARGVGSSDLTQAVRALEELGFLEKLGETYKIPSLYRDGLAVTQGKAFSSDPAAEDDDE
jgi:hypothetical protein